MAYIAHAIGYEYAYNCESGQWNIGQDFQQLRKASGDPFDGCKARTQCVSGCGSGLDPCNRLVLDYNDWTYAMTKIELGQGIVQSFAAESATSGTIENTGDEPSTATINTEIQVQKTVTTSYSDQVQNAAEYGFESTSTFTFSAKTSFGGGADFGFFNANYNVEFGTELQ